jgi:excisionase family DNA binding protein
VVVITAGGAGVGPSAVEFIDQSEVVMGIDPALAEEIRRIVRDELGQSDPAVRRMLGNASAAEFLGTHIRTLDRLVAKKRMPFVRVGGRRKFLIADLIAFQRANRVPAASSQPAA